MQHHSKKEIKEQLASTLGTALPDIKLLLGEKKFNKRIKKAAKIFVHGLHNGETETVTDQKQPEPQKPTPKKLKKAAPKKSAAKKHSN